MAQGSHKTKVTLPNKNKNNRVRKSTKVSKATTVQKTMKRKLEIGIKKNIEEQLCQQAKSCEGKSFHIIESKKK
jgi:hypothetical protein